MYTGPIIDTHMHFWDLANAYPWLNNRDPAIEQLIGNYEALRHNFLAPDYFAMTLGWNVVKSVHIQAFGFPDDPAGETEWVQKQTDKYGYPHGIVAYADLTESNLEDTLQRHCMHPNVHGIRMPLNYDKEDWRRMAKSGDYMRDKRWRKGFALLSRHGLVFDMQIYDHQIPDAVALARDFPETTLVVEHLAWPIDLSTAGFECWVQHLVTLTECPNVFLKVSGIGCVFQKSDPGLIRQYVRQAVDTFGPNRCVFGSNCPPDSLYYDFASLMKVYTEALSDYTTAEQYDLFCGTAQRVYGLKP